MTTDQYIQNINQRFKLGNATEHTFRGDLQNLIESLVPTIHATNEPKRQSCGAPDYILTQKEIPVGFIEAKDIGDKDLEGAKKAGNKEQFDRYKESLNNLIFTDYLDFHLYRDGVFIRKIAIGHVTEKGIDPLPENFAAFENFIRDFCTHIGQTIKSTKKLASMMAGKARLLSEVIEKALTIDVDNQENSTLRDQMAAFKQILIHDITPKGFADVYAQTITYGMFAARLHDPTLPTFSRQEAFELIPKSNPFLKKLFGYIAGLDLDDRIQWIVDDLVQIFLACNVEEMLKGYGKSTQMEDPIIHFYEDFLSEYDPKLRKARGVWYTPAPVVSFIVRAVDDILKSEFDLPQGLADTSKIKVKRQTQNFDKKSGKYVETEEEVHRVQILDPATGTGTFLAEVVKHIHKKFAGQQGIWSQYVENHLLPRLNGFELLMASYAMAHLKLDLLLTETGYKPTSNQRLRVYLTNSLEESHPDTGTLFANWLSAEANEANQIKRDTPVMCVIGNPPYSGISSNSGEWISRLIEDYKYVDGQHFNERKHWLNDDYVKFIRYGQHFIERNGSGVLGYINPHGYLDNPTFRGMRWNLLKTFDKIYTIDLHGNSKKKETSPDGSIDNNVFDIQQGVSINIFVKTGKKGKNELGEILHFDLYGKREFKYSFLAEMQFNNVGFQKLNPIKPNFFFLPKITIGLDFYEKGIKINEIFPINNVGFVSAHDGLNISFSERDHKEKINEILSLPEVAWRQKYKRPQDADSWKYIWAKQDAGYSKEKELTKVAYRPFDIRITLYTGKSGGLYARPIKQIMSHFIVGENVGLNWIRPMSTSYEFSIFISKYIIDQCSAGNKSAGAGISSIAPLYIYFNIEGKNIELNNYYRTPNLNPEIVQKIAAILGIPFVAEEVDRVKGVTSLDFLKGGMIGDSAPLNLPKGETSNRRNEELRPNVTPPLEGPGEGENADLREAIGDSAPLNLPEGEISSRRNEELRPNVTPPLEGPGEAETEGPEEAEKKETSEAEKANPGDHLLAADHEHPRYHTANAGTYRFTKEFKNELKKNPTEAEKVMWEKLRNKKTGYKIRRQHIIDDFIADFVCLSKKLVIEIDGLIHLQQKEYDEFRTARLNELGFEVIRFRNDEVFADADKVTAEIKNKLDLMADTSLNLDEEENWDGAPLNLPEGETSSLRNEELQPNVTPPLEGSGEGKNADLREAIGDSAPLNLPEGETSNCLNEELRPNVTPPLEGPGEAETLGPEEAEKKEPAKIKNPGTGFAPIDLLDYIYAVLHSPTYREKYKEFLKIDFPRVPYPKDVDTFWRLVALGGDLRTIHLLENSRVNDFITQYPIDGDNVVSKVRFEENYELLDGDMIIHATPAYPFGRVYINEDQFFQAVPLVAWEFYIGGYQPAQKWLKDRKERTLDFEDILHYQKIIVALTETDRLMKEIEEISIE